ncbi:PREDICTED: probable pectinesterase 56 [Erythranthe guttata]|nr:PREDICTED: probable pectinesterase 56 [Erythranthe guttata]|eukprot:XP_012846489.1 PREDICTED: probable pectinesterase 56 [Erythranthe guttata]
MIHPCVSAASTTDNDDNNTSPSLIDIHVDVEEFSPMPVPSLTQSSVDFDGAPNLSSFSLSQYSSIIAFPPSEINMTQPSNNNHHPRFRPTVVLAAITGFIISIIITTTLLGAFLLVINKKGKTNRNIPLECEIIISVSKDGRKSNFTTVTDAVKASPNYSQLRVCIHIGEGEYNEIVTIGHEKTNLVLIGEGIGKTTLSSNASNKYGSSAAATLRVIGGEFLAQDMTIRNGGLHNGVAVDSSGRASVFFRCKLQGAADVTLSIDGDLHFYRECHFYGKKNLVVGLARAFFQKCQFYLEKSHPQGKIVFFSQSSHISAYKFGFVFHLCEFYVLNKSETEVETAFIGSSLGNYTFYVIMESYLDPTVTGYFLGTPPNVTYYATFRNVGPGATKANVPQFVHVLGSVEAASHYSLRRFLLGDNWITKAVDYDLDIVE